jgi:arabinogalactan oligomer / maltooligosaccharide transport system substrate-binding protein
MRSLRWRLLMGVVAFVLLGAACGGDDDGGEPTTPAATTAEPTEEPTEEPTTEPAGQLLIWADETRAPVIQTFADEFGAANGVEVTIQTFEFDQIRDQLQQAGPAGEGPDIIVGAHDWLGQLATNGVVEPLDLGGREGEFLEVGIQAFTYNGQLYGLPYAVENVALLRNTDLVPEAPATFEELEQTALGLVESGDAEIALGMQVPDPFHQYPLYTAACECTVFAQNADGTYDPTQLTLDTPGGLAAAEKFGEWTDSGLINADITYDVMIEAFGTGNAPFAITGPWAISQEDTGFAATGVPFVVEPIPTVEGATAKPFVAVQGFMISAFSENKLLAQTFVVDFMGTEEAQLALYQAGGRPPALQAAFDQAASDPNIAGFGLSGAQGAPMPAIPEMASVWTAWTDAYTNIFTGQAAPEQAFTSAAEQIRNLIAGG